MRHFFPTSEHYTLPPWVGGYWLWRCYNIHDPNKCGFTWITQHATAVLICLFIIMPWR